MTKIMGNVQSTLRTMMHLHQKHSEKKDHMNFKPWKKHTDIYINILTLGFADYVSKHSNKQNIKIYVINHLKSFKH